VITITNKIISGPDIPGEIPKEANSYNHISFRDNGIGFDQEFSEKIFQAFQRLHSRTEFSGTGIGLAIVKKIVHNHNGIIDAQSKPGIGTTFHIYLPVNGNR
jgi:signal transduction histidine kinase